MLIAQRKSFWIMTQDCYCHSVCHRGQNEAARHHLCLQSHLHYRLNEWTNSGVVLMRKTVSTLTEAASRQFGIACVPLTWIKITFQAFFCPDWKPLHWRNATQYIGDSSVYVSYRSTGLSCGSDSLPDAEVTHNPGDQETQSHVPVYISQVHVPWHS